MASAQRTRVSKRRQETRERLLDAALDVVASDGFHGASVQAIATKAGYSVGAVYSNFSGKDDLFFALFEERIRWMEFHRDVKAAARAPDPAVQVRAWMEQVARDPARFLAFIEFWAYAMRRPQIRRKLAVRLREMRAVLAKALGDRPRSSVRGDLDPEEFALAALALGRGLTLEMLADPRAVTDSHIARILARMMP